MRGGFTFCGTDIADIGLEYAPENEHTYVYKEGEYDIQEQTFEAHDGGYVYGATMQPKEFILRCYFQDTSIKNGIMDRVRFLFRRGKTGRLCFCERPWLWYIATVAELDTSDLKSRYNGIITITMKAYYPFARTDLLTIDPSVSDQIDISRNSGLLYEADRMPPAQLIAENPMTETTSFLLYNPGTEAAHTAIEIAGTATAGFTITNKTNGQVCRIALASPDLYGEARWLKVDGLTGETYLTDGTTAQHAFLYHDSGFIDLEPSYPIIRHTLAKYTRGSNQVILKKYTPWLVTGQYIWLNGAWRKITNQPEERKLTLEQPMDADGEETTDIVTMNELTVAPVNPTGFNLTKLNFIYKPTFS